MSSTPIEPSGDGRDPKGRFAAGNPGGKGNPYARQVAALRAALLGAVKPEDLAAIVTKLAARAKAGDVQAAKLLLERLLGPAVAADVLERVERLESMLGAKVEQQP